MRIILFRHGPAADPDSARWTSDADRPLTPRGIERTRLAASGLARIAGKVAVILTSPYVRAQETARILGAALGVERIEVLEALSSGGATNEVMATLTERSPATTVLVGHEPDLGLLAGMMTGTGRSLPLDKAGACAVEFAVSSRATPKGHLIWYLPPDILCEIGATRTTPA